MDETETPAPESSPTEPSPMVPPRRSVARKRPSPEPNTSGGNDAQGFIAFLSELYTQSKGGSDEANAAELAPERTQSLLQAKRLPRSGGGGGGEATALESTTRGEGSGSIAPVLGVMKPRATRPPRQSPWRQTIAWLVAGGLTLGVAWAAWSWWEARPVSTGQTVGGVPSSSGPVRPTGPVTVSDAALQVSDQAMEAIAQGDLTRASEILTEARNRQVVLPGLLYQSAWLAYRGGEQDKAEKLLDASVEANEAVPECEYLYAATAAAQGNYRGATEKMAEAARFAAFSPRYYFYWAECLRRQGKPAEAILRFEQALLRRPSSADAELINFKRNLAKLEAGNDPGFQAEIAAKLKEENVSASVLLIAAANEVIRGAYAEATPYLQRAAQAMPPAVFHVRMRDYLFRLPDREKERAAEWAKLEPQTPIPADMAALKVKASLVDPATRGLAETDPATW